MTDFDSTDRVLQHQAEEMLARWAHHRGADAVRLLQVINDAMTLEDRIEFINAGVWFGEEVLPVEPEVGIIDGRDTGLFYRSCVNLLYGTDGCGKTLLMQKIIMQELEAGNEVMYLDAEEGSPRNMILRLQQMGVLVEWGDRFHYCNLDRPPSQMNRDMFVETAKRCSLVVIDSAGEFMGMYGKDATKDLETRGVLFEMFGRPLAKAGAAVVILDHIAKSSDGSMPIGSIRKRAAVDGAAYFLNIDEGNEWSKTKSGFGSLTCTKDRNGTYFRGQFVSRIQVWPAASSVDGMLVVELTYNQLDDVLDKDLIETPAPPAYTGPVDIELEVLRIIEQADMPVRNRYILDELNRHVEKKMTRATFEALIKNMRERGFIGTQDGALIALVSSLSNHRKND